MPSRIATYIFGIAGVAVGLLAGFGLVFFQVSLFITRFIVPPEDYMFQSPSLIFSTLGSGGLATLSALLGIVALGIMIARPSSRAAAVLFLVAALFMALVLPVMTLGFFASLVEFLIFPIMPTVLLLAAGILAVFARPPQTSGG